MGSNTVITSETSSRAKKFELIESNSSWFDEVGFLDETVTFLGDIEVRFINDILCPWIRFIRKIGSAIYTDLLGEKKVGIARHKKWGHGS